LSEQDLTRAILEALTAKGFWCWRVNSGASVVGEGNSRRFVRMAPTGSPDIMGIVGDGYLFGLEVKLAKTKQTPGQIAWQRKAAEHGVRYRVVRSISEAIETVCEWLVLS
jgi:hypothetical protein